MNYPSSPALGERRYNYTFRIGDMIHEAWTVHEEELRHLTQDELTRLAAFARDLAVEAAITGTSEAGVKIIVDDIYRDAVEEVLCG